VGLTRCLAREVGRYSITADNITAGLTLTPAVREHFPPHTPACRRADGTTYGGPGREDLVHNLTAATRPRPQP